MVKPLDLANLLREAHEAGRNGIAWVDFSPNPTVWTRVDTALRDFALISDQLDEKPEYTCQVSEIDPSSTVELDATWGTATGHVVPLEVDDSGFLGFRLKGTRYDIRNYIARDGVTVEGMRKV